MNRDTRLPNTQVVADGSRRELILRPKTPEPVPAARVPWPYTKAPAVRLPSLALLAGLLAGCGGKPENTAVTESPLPTAQVQVRAAASRKQISIEEVVGTVRAKLHATLEAKVSGRITQLPLVLGQNVKASQLVARLDAAEVQARLDQAQAALEQSERDWNRIVSLFASQAVTRSEYDAAEAHHRGATAAVAEARAMLGYLEVLAPFDGVVMKKWADVGDLAVPGKPLIELEDPSVLQLEADVPEGIASRIQPGARLEIRIDAASGQLSGTVAELAPAADPTSRTLRVKLALPQTPELRSGQFGRLLVPIGEQASVRVPAGAVVLRGQMEIVFVVAERHAQLHLVKTGKRVGDEIEILSGLDSGDQVVIRDAALLRDGQPVEAR